MVRRRAWPALRRLGRGAALSLLGLLAIEGACSLYWVARDYRAFTASLPRAEVFTEERHARYDAELGWVHIPGVTLEDFYGPGATVTINAQGLRGLEDYSRPSGLFRVVCLGDSFTFGYGVSDHETWPAWLEQFRPGLQAVNMGQGGYSLGQCILWYRRAGPALQPGAVVLAIIPDDIRRLTGERLVNGYGKPTFRLRGGKVEVGNQPVPPKIETGRAVAEWSKTRAFLGGHGGLSRSLVRLAGPPEAASAGAIGREALDVALRLIGDFRDELDARRVPLFLVLMPELDDLRDPARQRAYESLSRECAALAASMGFGYTDLFDRFAAAREPEQFFNLAQVWPHYSAAGYALVAREVDALLAARARH